MSDNVNFLQKIKELVWSKLSQFERNQFNHIAAGFAGGKAKSEAMKTQKQGDEDAIWSKVNKNAKGGCWEWTGALNDRGYPYIWINSNAVRAHRVVYEMEHGSIKDGFQLHHKCNNKICVNPSHMEQLNNKDNNQRKQSEEPKRFPYTKIEELPDGVKDALPSQAQRIWMAAFNNAIGRYPDNEGRAAQIAWGAVKNAGYKQDQEGNWKKATDVAMAYIIDDEHIITSLEASEMNKFPFISELTFSEDGMATGQVFPKMGTYKHERYGEIKVTKEFLEQVKKNFENRVYQQDLPLTIDIEHQPSLSGAIGEFEELEIRGSDGMWAKAKLNDRGKTLLGDNRFKYFSPEYYDKWVDPATDKQYTNLLTGGALCVKPFFKGMEPWMLMSEEGLFVFTEYEPEHMSDPLGPDASDVHVPTVAQFAFTKTDDGEQYPAEAYLYVPDREKPSTWKLRIWETPESKVTRTQLGRAAAAFSPGGFRGQKVQLPAEDRKAVLAKLKGLYSKEGVKPDELPAYIRASMIEVESSEDEINNVLTEMGFETGGEKEMGMTEDEIREFTEMKDSMKQLGEKLDATEKAKEVAEGELKKAVDRIGSMETSDRQRKFTDIVRGRNGETDGAPWYGETEKHVEHMVKLADAFGDDSDELKHYIDVETAHATQLSESELLKEKGSRTPPTGSAVETFETKVDEKVKAGMSVVDAQSAVTKEDPRLYSEVRNASYDKSK